MGACVIDFTACPMFTFEFTGCGLLELILAFVFKI